jgi:hypothetical protein
VIPRLPVSAGSARVGQGSRFRDLQMAVEPVGLLHAAPDLLLLESRCRMQLAIATAKD